MKDKFNERKTTPVKFYGRNCRMCRILLANDDKINKLIVGTKN